jgi:hypothetical protein
MTELVLFLLAIVVACNTAALVLIHRQLTGVRALVYVSSAGRPLIRLRTS